MKHTIMSYPILRRWTRLPQFLASSFDPGEFLSWLRDMCYSVPCIHVNLAGELVKLLNLILNPVI